MALVVVAGFIVGLLLLPIVLIRSRRRAIAARKAERWADTLEHAERALAEYQRGPVPLRCVLVTGYAVANEGRATALIEWVQRGTGEWTRRWAENDPTFGPYWVVETRTEPLPITPRLAVRWVARMRLTCKEAACRLHHYAVHFGGSSPTGVGEPLSAE